MVAEMAASRGAINALKLLRTHGVAWDSASTAAAATHNQYACLWWLVESGCPLWERVVGGLLYTRGVEHAKRDMLVADGDENARVLLYAARCGAPLPQGAEAEARERGAQASALATCFQKASKLAMTSNKKRKRNTGLWIAMGGVPMDLVMNIADIALLWVKR
jgi:hypothetical protein